MPCSLCGAQGVNILTCPLNPEAKNPKPLRHNVAAQATGQPQRPIPPSVSAATRIPASASTLVKPMKQLKIKAKPKTADPKFAQTAESFARREFPGDVARQQEYIADAIRLAMPDVPVGDKIDRLDRERKAKVAAHQEAIKNNCMRCTAFIQKRGLIKDNDATRWSQVGTACQECQRAISALYHADLPGSKVGYNRYHTGQTLPVDTLPYLSYYNGTMYKGAEDWAARAVEKSLKALNVPKNTLKKK